MNGHRPTYKAPRDLPIYRATMQIMETIDTIHDDFQRDRRHTLWQQLCNEAGKLQLKLLNKYAKKRNEKVRVGEG